MGIMLFVQVVVDFILIGGIAWLLIDRTRASKRDDPRLSRGLQILQNKIAVFQDLMERSETFSNQMTQLLDRKQREVQEKIEEASVHIHRVKESINRSTEVARIFQDKIPHQEIIERQNTLKYVHAAKLAHAGTSVDEIQKQTGLPQGEVELIAKLNRDRIMVADTPEWVEEYESGNQSEGRAALNPFHATAHRQPSPAPAFNPTATQPPSTPQPSVTQPPSATTSVSAAIQAAAAAAAAGEINRPPASRRSNAVLKTFSEAMGVQAVVANKGMTTTVYPVAFKKLSSEGNRS